MARNLSPSRYTVEVWGYNGATGTFNLWVRRPAGASLWDRLFANALGAVVPFQQIESAHKKRLFYVEASVGLGNALPGVTQWGIVSGSAGPSWSPSVFFDLHDLARRTDDGIEDYVTMWVRSGQTAFSIGVSAGPIGVKGGLKDIQVSSINNDPEIPPETELISFTCVIVSLGWDPISGGGVDFFASNGISLDLFNSSFDLGRLDIPGELLEYIANPGSLALNALMNYWSVPGTSHYGNLNNMLSRATGFLPRAADTSGASQ